MIPEHKPNSPFDMFSPWPWWNGWLGWISQWQGAWFQALGGLAGVSGARPTLPMLWDPGFLMPRIDARITPVVSEEGNEAARVSMMMRLPRFGCVGPADLVAVEAFVARRPDPTALNDLAHPSQSVTPLPAQGAVALPATPVTKAAPARAGRVLAAKPAADEAGATATAAVITAAKSARAPRKPAVKTVKTASAPKTASAASATSAAKSTKPAKD